MNEKQNPDFDIARAWKDTEYRKSLSADQLGQLPPNPAGNETMTDEELDGVSGGMMPKITVALDCKKLTSGQF